MVKIEDTGLRPGMFILTEANGQRSRENAYIAQPATVQPGDFLTFSSAGTSDDRRAGRQPDLHEIAGLQIHDGRDHVAED